MTDILLQKTFSRETILTIAFILLTNSVYSSTIEVIVLKSGERVEAIIETREDSYIVAKVNNVSMAYFLDEVESIKPLTSMVGVNNKVITKDNTILDEIVNAEIGKVDSEKSKVIRREEIFSSKISEISRDYTFRESNVGNDNYVEKDFYDDGQIYSEDYIENNTIVAKKTYYRDGALKREEFYKDGVLHGVTVSYYQNGGIDGQWVYKNGQLDGPVKNFYEDGSLEYEYSYKGNKRDGKAMGYYKDGNLEYETYYKEGKKISKKKYNPNGSLLYSYS